MDGAPGASCSVGQAFPIGWSQLDELAPQDLELGGPVIVLDVLRVVRDGVDQPVPRQIAFDDEMPQNTSALG